MDKSFNELMHEASIARSESALFVKYIKTFDDYADWNLENTLNSSIYDELAEILFTFAVDLTKLTAHFNGFVGDRINYLVNTTYWDNESQVIPADIYALYDDLIDLSYDDTTLEKCYES